MDATNYIAISSQEYAPQVEVTFNFLNYVKKNL